MVEGCGGMTIHTQALRFEAPVAGEAFLTGDIAVADAEHAIGQGSRGTADTAMLRFAAKIPGMLGRHSVS